MLAHHPETGQQIRILRSDAQITQSRRTLVWLQAGYSKSPRWQRWKLVLTDPAAWTADLSKESVAALVIHEFTEAWIPMLRILEDTCLIIVRKDQEAAVKRAGFAAETYLNYEDLFHMYPFLGEPVGNQDSIEKVVVSVAHILRFQHLVWTPRDVESAGVKAQLHAWQKTCGGQIQIVPANAVAEDVVPACWLIQQYFQHSNSRRAKEINRCLEKNVANPFIDRILLLNEKEYASTGNTAAMDSPKIQQRVIDRRMTYRDVLEAIRTDLPAGAFAIFSNSDIWCDESLQLLWSIPMRERRLFLALLRWEDGETPTLFGPRPDSQDTWIVAKETVDFVATEEDFGFPFGKPGCDNAIALAMLKKRCLVVNPAHSLKTYHVHATKIRDYNPRDVLYKPAYLYMDPTPVQLFAVEPHMKAWEAKSPKAEVWRLYQPRQSFTRQIHSINEQHAKTVCRAIRDKEGEEFQAEKAANLWTPSPQTRPLYEMRDAFASDTGLLSNFQSIFVGGHEAWRRGWQDSTISTVATTIHVPALVSVVTTEACWKSLAVWCLQYLPTVLRLRRIVGAEYEFLVPTLPDVPPFLYDCRWRDTHVGTIPHLSNTQYYCNRLIAPAPQTAAKVTKEDVEILRELLAPTPPAADAAATGSTAKKTGGPTIVHCLDAEDDPAAIFTAGWVEEWRTCHSLHLRGARILTVRPTDSAKVRREAFQAADWIFGSREGLRWIWMAKPDTRIVEWMLETEISSEIIHLAGAASCKYILSLVRKEPVEFQREHAIIVFAKIWSEYAFPEVVEATVGGDKPLILLPAGKALRGLWTHTGDSFREMVRLWEQRGLCRVEETEDSGFVWWGNVGDVLLFDWDIARWWDPATNYQLALFGNCARPGPAGHETRQSVWGFWGRHPIALEAAAEKGRLGWAERIIRSLFLGKVENGVQKARRCGADWSTAVDLFSMPIDSTGAPYPYTQSEYLEKLRQSRFGLCLPGYGTKCNREIEYLALGVVPIVTPGVDVTNYLVPPEEGVHYLRAETPADVRRLVEETSEETWEAMSAACHSWWRQNASAEGLFRLTWGRIEQCRTFQGLMIPPWK